MGEVFQLSKPQLAWAGISGGYCMRIVIVFLQKREQFTYLSTHDHLMKPLSQFGLWKKPIVTPKETNQTNWNQRRDAW